MRFLVWSSVLFVSACTLSAQQPTTVTANVSTTQNIAAGTATFQVQFLDTNLASTVDTAVGALKDTGAGVSNLTGVSVSISQGFVITQYDFTVAVPAGQFAALRDRLIAIQRSLQTANTQGLGWSTTYTASNDDTTQALQTALPGLLAQARQQAGVLASALGMTVVAVQSVSAPAITPSGLSVVIGLTVTYTVQ